MNWFDTSGLTSLAKNALKEAQKTIDKALDIQDESGEEPEDDAASPGSSKSSPGAGSKTQQDSSDFFSSWGLTVSAESAKDDEPKSESSVVTESPSKAPGMWGSFAGSFFEQPKDSDSAIVRPPKAKSMNIISDKSFDSQDDLFTHSQLVMSDTEKTDCKTDKLLKTDEPCLNNEERRSSSRSAGISLLSSRNSSDSVEILSHSMKTTPDSEPPSVHSVSHSSSIDKKLNSDSVEILPDSLVSPSSIECLGFDSYSSDKNSSSSSNLTPSDEKATPIGERTEKIETADSVSLVADDDEDTVSYNSISECTAPTVLDTDDKTSPYSRSLKGDSQRKFVDRELIHLEAAAGPKMHISENSSNDGSWSDRTLNADNESVNLDVTLEEQKKEVSDQEDVLIEKLSDSSSFYNVQVSSRDMLRSESSAFVNVEKQHCRPTDSSESSQKDGSTKERISPVSSESKSDLVKIGSDRTSGHTSGDELETTTSSDIEIIPSPSGDNNGFRNSPAKYKQGKFDGSMSPNLVDLVLGKSLASKIRGHNRELSEASVQSNTSEESCSENDKLMRRLCEMAEVLEAREARLLEVSRSNAELADNNADLKSQLETLQTKHEVGDINVITEDYTQRMSALEKKFQQAIREKDQLRKQIEGLKCESVSRKNSSELENMLKERDDIISQLQEEGEKLSRQQLQHSNIIKKLRAKEKDNEQVIKSLRDKIAEQASELDRLKRSMAAKEELEVTQIEAVYRLTTANKKYETEIIEIKSALDDTTQRLESSRTSLEAARKELTDCQRNSSELARKREDAIELERERDSARSECELLRAQLQQLRNEMVQEERRWMSREESLRREVSASRPEPVVQLEALAAPPAALLRQLQELQHELTRSRGRNASLQNTIAELESTLSHCKERESLSRVEITSLVEQLSTAEGIVGQLEGQVREAESKERDALDKLADLGREVDSKKRELEAVRSELSERVSELERRLSETETQLNEERATVETEKKRNALLQEQLSSSVRGDVSPASASDSMSVALWQHEMFPPSPPIPQAGLYTPYPLEGRAGGVVGGVGGVGGELRRVVSELQRATSDRAALTAHVAKLQGDLDDYQAVRAQHEALLQMYGEKEEQLSELRLDLKDVTALYKAQLEELIALRRRVAQE